MIKEYSDIAITPPAELPPVRAIYHKIPLIDEKKILHCRTPKCPDALRTQLAEKLERYTKAGWWVETSVPAAIPMLCIAKKDGKLRTALDARKRNDNTVKDVTPFPDQDAIRHDCARAKFRSKLDMSDAYEQVRVHPDDIWKTAFATIYGTYVSTTMQIGDCNAPATFQRLMTIIFRDYIGRFVHCYLDDIFIYSETAEEHEKHLRMIFKRMRDNKMYLSKTKCDVFADKMDCLGHIIDDEGIHAAEDKMRIIREWVTPQSYHDVQRFLGLVQYLAHFMPDVSAYTSPLSGMVRNSRPFVWNPIQERCFQTIKALACKSPILKPIDPTCPEPIWVVCDASVTGVGAYVGQGREWKTCRPAGFISKKFSSAQMSYRTYEQETVAILEALMKWEDKLIGNKFTIVTDHQSLEYFKTQAHLSNRQIRWWQFLSRFDYDVQYVEGKSNVVADALSRCFKHDDPDAEIRVDQRVTVDTRLDPEGDYLPFERIIESKASRVRAKTLKERIEPRVVESEIMKEKSAALLEDDHLEDKDDVSAVQSRAAEEDLMVTVEQTVNIKGLVKDHYGDDPIFAKILAKPEHFKMFKVENGLIFMKNKNDREVLCIPKVKHERQRLSMIIMESAHTALGHLAERKTVHYIKRWFWWPSMVSDIQQFCQSCETCQTTKGETLRPAGLLHSLPIPTKPWSSIAMDFIGPFPVSEGYDYLLVVIDRLTSMVHLIPTTTKVKATGVALLYFKEIVRLHGMPETIVSDRDSKFTGKFWKELHRLVGIKLLMSTAFHPQTDGQAERAMRTIGQILRTLVESDQKDWSRKCPMVEFAINSAISDTTGFAPFELVYGLMPAMMTEPSSNTPFKGVQDFADKAFLNLSAAHDAIIAQRVRQTHNANTKRRTETALEVGSRAYLSTEKLNLPKARARKLAPKFIGPYLVTSSHSKDSTYTLELPPELKARRIHPTFHVSRLRRHIPNNDDLFPSRESKKFYDFGNDAEDEWRVASIRTHRWKKRALELEVEWEQGDITWEPLEQCNQLQALDEYLELRGVDAPSQLP
jgi:hypothetical protein